MDVLGCLGALALIPVLYVFHGYVLSVLWEWFMVPVFHLPLLSIPYAIGISMVVSTLTHQTGLAREKYDAWYAPLIGMLTYPAVTLGIAWVVKQWV